MIPVPVPFPFQLTYAVTDGYLLVGSTPDAIAQAIVANKSGKGLVATEAFRTAFEGQPVNACSALSYCGRQLSGELHAFQSKMFDLSQVDAEMASMLKQFMGSGASAYSATTMINDGKGFRMQGVTSAGGGQMLSSMVVVPVVGMLSAIAIPSFVNARTTSQKNACINNLRQIDGAKEQWAMVNNKRTGDVAPADEISVYIKGSAIPQCPQGGDYTLGAIGEDPTCSIPEHRLPY
jgi:hypothetical protein